MLFNLIKEINRLLSSVSISVKKISPLRKEINRLLIKRVANICVTVTIETFLKLRFSGFKKFFYQVSFGELQLA